MPTEDIRKKMGETYTMTFRCKNCGNEFEKEIPKGVPCCGYEKCPNCGCRETTAVITSGNKKELDINKLY